MSRTRIQKPMSPPTMDLRGNILYCVLFSTLQRKRLLISVTRLKVGQVSILIDKSLMPSLSSPTAKSIGGKLRFAHPFKHKITTQTYNYGK